MLATIAVLLGFLVCLGLWSAVGIVLARGEAEEERSPVAPAARGGELVGYRAARLEARTVP